MVPTTEQEHTREKPPSLRERQRQEREAIILAEAERMLGERGYHEITMEELAERVGIGKGTIYLHFPGKEDLIRAIVLRGMARMTATLDAIAADDTRPAQARLRGIIAMLLAGKEEWFRILSDRGQRELMASLWQHGAMREQRSRLLASLAGLIDQGKARGEFRPDVHSEAAVIWLFGLMRSTDSRLLSDVTSLDHAALAEEAIRMYFHGLCMDTGEKEARA